MVMVACMPDCQYVLIIYFGYFPVFIITYCVVAIMYSIIISWFCATVVVNNDEYIQCVVCQFFLRWNWRCCRLQTPPFQKFAVELNTIHSSIQHRWEFKISYDLSRIFVETKRHDSHCRPLFNFSHPPGAPAVVPRRYTYTHEELWTVVNDIYTVPLPCSS